MAGLEAMHEAGASVGFESSKAAFIGGHGDEPLLLVQGPPGTGKSFTTAFAVLARLQGAMAAGMPYRVLVGAKTHAATDVLLANVLSARQSLARMRDEQPANLRRVLRRAAARRPALPLAARGEIRHRASSRCVSPTTKPDQAKGMRRARDDALRHRRGDAGGRLSGGQRGARAGSSPTKCSICWSSTRRRSSACPNRSWRRCR